MSTQASRIGSSLSRNDMIGILEIVHSSRSCDSNRDFLAIMRRLQQLLPFDHAYAGLATCTNDGQLIPKNQVQFNFPDEFLLEYIAKGHLSRNRSIELAETRKELMGY